MNSQEIENIVEEYSRIQNLIEEYTREVMGNAYNGPNGFTVEKLISQSREFREMNQDIMAYRCQGYKDGYEAGLRNAPGATITFEKLRCMTIQDIANLIGVDE